ncbi:hypothetical protein Fot_23372 [Forsythia ovata]|uniref:Uncharacterized protein n=1 Tax=Forsythia ovata TaxID=205694 RepID=A0ABD1V0C9_9LAMI
MKKARGKCTHCFHFGHGIDKCIILQGSQVLGKKDDKSEMSSIWASNTSGGMLVATNGSIRGTSGIPNNTGADLVNNENRLTDDSIPSNLESRLLSQIYVPMK